jgi:hypothetical protein
MTVGAADRSLRSFDAMEAAELYDRYPALYAGSEILKPFGAYNA